MNDAAKLLRRGYESYERGDIDGVMTLLADDLVWHMPGRGPLSSDYKGKDELAAFFARKKELSSGTFRQRVHSVLGDGSRAVGFLTYFAERDGRALEAKCVHIADLENGKVVEFSEFFEDQYAWDEFWS